MKRYRIILAVLSAMSAFSLIASCSGEKDDIEKDTVTLQIDKKSLEFGYEEESAIVTVTTSGKLYIVPGADWTTASSAPLQENTYAVTVNVKANTDTQERQTRISVVAGEAKEYIEVRQAAYTVKPYEPVDNEASKWARSLGLGWNLGNQMDAHINGTASETVWGNKLATQATMDGVKEAGFGTVRIPVTWMGHIGAAPEYTIEKEWLDRVVEIVGYAEKAGLNAIVNIHHDGADSKYWLSIKDAAASDEKAAQIKAELTAIWTQIAERFSDKGDFLIFESMNEIHDGDWGWGGNRNDDGKQYRILNEWNQAFVDAVRNTGGKNAVRVLGIPGYCTDPVLTLDNLILPNDKAEGKIAVAVHYYAPHDYTLNNKYTEWGHTGETSKKAPGNMDEDYLRDIFGRLNSKYVANGIPCYIGEFGCDNKSGDRAEDFQEYYLEYVCKAANTYGLAPILWDNGAIGTGEESSGYLDHATGKIINDTGRFIKAMVKGATSDDSNYTLETVYNNAPRK